MTGRALRACAATAVSIIAGGCAEIAGAAADASLVCMPAVTTGAKGTLPALGALPADQPVSAMLVWPKRIAPKAAEAATAAGATVVGTYASHRALGVRATGPQLTRLARELAGAEVFLASAGTSQLCVSR